MFAKNLFKIILIIVIFPALSIFLSESTYFLIKKNFSIFDKNILDLLYCIYFLLLIYIVRIFTKYIVFDFIKHKDIVLILLVTIVFWVIVNILDTKFNINLNNPFFIEYDNIVYVENTIILILLIVVFSPLLIEILYRGILQPMLISWIQNKYLSIILISILSLFLAEYIDSINAAIVMFLWGCYLGYLKEKYQSLTPSLVSAMFMGLLNSILTLFLAIN